MINAIYIFIIYVLNNAVKQASCMKLESMKLNNNSAVPLLALYFIQHRLLQRGDTFSALKKTSHAPVVRC